MKLDQYEVSFSNFPWLSPVGPFGGWGYTGGLVRILSGTTRTTR
ncbi:hypothetical protein SAMN05444164_3356 [Bradyrhizobium erythrophlei]|uniref:Uncharacterized protein n=1 Tax=Bradyrhizobium erythrophlei TaxID=1437360 RepID=A0A1H4X2M5_9BRAD|nr:hypothetical protein SAMN05444164_3356 [Bradyrhizobium erythrophlei]